MKRNALCRIITSLAIVIVIVLLSPQSALSADITGIWKAEFETQIGIQKYAFDFKMTGNEISGLAKSDIGGELQEVPLTEVKLDSQQISFVEIMMFQGMELRITYQGTVAGNEMKLTRNVGDFVAEELIAKREEATGEKK